jgi:hypothetical protein
MKSLLIVLSLLIVGSNSKSQWVSQAPSQQQSVVPSSNDGKIGDRTYFKQVYIGMPWEEFIGGGNPDNAQNNINKIHELCEPLQAREAAAGRRAQAATSHHRDDADKNVAPLTIQESRNLLECRALLSQMDNIAAGRPGTFPSPSSNAAATINYEFKDKKVYAITVFFIRTSFSEQLENLSAKYGKPSDVNDVQLQNGYGAKSTAHFADWKMPDGTHIEVYASPNQDYESATVRFKGAAALAEEEKKYEANRKETNPY